MRDELHADHLRAIFSASLRRLGELDAAAFAAAAGMNLRLDDDDAGAETPRDLAGFDGVNATSPRGTGTPWRARIAFA